MSPAAIATRGLREKDLLHLAGGQLHRHQKPGEGFAEWVAPTSLLLIDKSHVSSFAETASVLLRLVVAALLFCPQASAIPVLESCFERRDTNPCR